MENHGKACSRFTMREKGANRVSAPVLSHRIPAFLVLSVPFTIGLLTAPLSAPSAAPLLEQTSDDETRLGGASSPQATVDVEMSSIEMRCWQNGREILARHFGGEIRLGSHPSQRTLTLSNARGRGTRALIVEIGDAVCLAEISSPKKP